MNSKERVLKALSLEEPDRVPVFDYDINSPVASKILGRKAFTGIGATAYSMYYDLLIKGKRDKLVERRKKDWVELYEKLDLDIVPARLVWSKNVDYPRHLKKISEDRYLWEWGEIYGFKVWYLDLLNFKSDFASTIDSWIRRGGIEALKAYVKSLESSSPSIDYSEFELIEYVVKEVGDKRFILGDVGSGTFPVGHDWYVVFIKALYKYPDLIRRLIYQSVRRAEERIKVAVDFGVDAISCGIDYAGKNGPLISPRHFREFILPALKRITDLCHRLGVFFIKHTDGNIMPIERELLVESGIDGYLAIEPVAGMDIGYLKEKYGDRIALLGNVDCAYTLVYGSEEDVRRETRKVIDLAANGGGLVVASSNSIHSGVKVENFLAMISEARRYGRYPLRRRDGKWEYRGRIVSIKPLGSIMVDEEGDIWREYLFEIKITGKSKRGNSEGPSFKTMIKVKRWCSRSWHLKKNTYTSISVTELLTSIFGD
ncbi:MAG: hypothetical protein DRZ82_03695 [Thermoprotei archaeon]|nr:MAG: hypothetical protein DRZ82_03695 [Thermoprotei archaeon]